MWVRDGGERPPRPTPLRRALQDSCTAGWRPRRAGSCACRYRAARGPRNAMPGVTWRFPLLYGLLNHVRHRWAGAGLGPRFPLYTPLGTRRFKRNAKEELFLQNVSPRVGGTRGPRCARARHCTQGLGVRPSPSTGTDGKISHSHGDFADLVKPLVSSKF